MRGEVILKLEQLGQRFPVFDRPDYSQVQFFACQELLCHAFHVLGSNSFDQ